MKAHFELYDNFEPHEFECPCCGQQNMQHGFMKKLQKAREIAGVSFSIGSGYRCESYNQKLVDNPNLKASKDSSHKKGIACDINIPSGHSRFKILEGLIKAGFKRIGEAKTFFHVDSDCSKPQETKWGY